MTNLNTMQIPEWVERGENRLRATRAKASKKFAAQRRKARLQRIDDKHFALVL